MRRNRIFLCVAATLSATLWAYACGDGITEPPTPSPDAPRPTTVTVTPATTQLTALGATVQLSAEVRDQNGQVMAGAGVTWTSSNASVATVSGSGLATAAGNGTATITATAGSVSGSAAVTVAQEVSTVVVSPAEATLVHGDTLRLTAGAVDANGHAVAGAEFEWTSSDTSVVAVDASGLATGVGLGEAEVSATSSGVSDSAALVVAEPTPTTVAVTPDTVALMALGDTVRLVAEVRDQLGRVMEDEPVTWVSGDTIVAAVDSAGLVTAVGTGATRVTGTAGDAFGSAAVTVMQSAGSVEVSPAADTIAPGDTLRLLAEAYDENGHPVESAQFSWSSNDVSVARVDGSGLVHGVAEGTATITATAGDARGTSEITVENPDRAALVALYKATGGKYWTNRDNWLSDVPLKDWYGVEVNAEGRVISLELLENGLVGHLPPELGDLAELEVLELYDNPGLTGAIPPEFGSLPNLQRLDVGGNRLTGSIPPELGNLSKLESLELGRNGLTGSIPPELGNLSELRRIWIGNNDLTGPIPPELGKLSNLRRLYLGGAYLTGPIPPELSQLTHLRRLYLDDNRLTGGVPPELGNLSNLEDLRLKQNQLTGAFPMSVLRITGLEFLQIQENAGLCVPETTDFVEWAAAIDDREGPFCNQADRTALDSLYGAAGGTNWTNAGGWRGEGAVGDRHGVSADSLGRVLELDLAGNGLAGVVSSELGDLGHMTVLKLGGNDLSGRLPQSLARVPLREFRYADTELCVPPTGSFQEWLDGIAEHEGTGAECAPFSDREALVALYEATDGPNWTNQDNWLTHAPLKDWYGVEVNAEGRVISLDLYRNGLVGELPAELVNLAALESLELGRNGLTGAIPPEFGSLPNLQWLALGRNRLTGPIPPELGNLSELGRMYLDGNELTGPIPPELGNLSELARMYLDGNKLTGPIPPELGRLSALETLDLGYNPLSGPIPSELGNLSNLRYLKLGRDAAWTYPYADKRRPPVLGARYPALTGPIPPELGRLTNLEELDLGWNDLTGPIPPELDNLAKLLILRLEANRLSGSIPAEIGNISSLTDLLLAKNDLTGPVPSTIGDLSSLKQLVLSRNELTGALPLELGRLADLWNLDLEYNGLSGTLPPELGSLAELEHLILNFNALTGSLPAELSGLASLRRMGLTDNTGMSGALPSSLTALDQLEDLAVGGTELCAPGGAEFAGWLAALNSAYVAPCGSEPAVAYLTQAVQSRQIPVPLVAGDDALLRVFVTARRATTEGIPPVRVRIYIDGRETHVEEIPGKPGPLPTEVDEGSLETSANAVIPGTLVQPGLEMVAEIDPDGTLDPSLGVARRIPETGRLPVDVQAMPKFRLTIVPFLWREKPDSTVLAITREMAADPLNHELLWKMNTLLPIADDYDLILHDPVLTSNNVSGQMTLETDAIRVMEGSDRYHMGTMTGEVVATKGSNIRRSIATLVEEGNVGHVTHEFGHTMTLGHAPGCWPGSDDGNVDPSYPYSTGITGVWGYDFRDGGMLVRPQRAEVMAFCGGYSGGWISDYHFTKALRHRLRNEVDDGTAAAAASVPSLLLWGGVDEAGVPFLEPALVVDASPVRPDSAGAYEVVGLDAGGGELFSLRFAMPEAADSSATGFVFVLPARPEWANTLASITLSGPAGSVVLDSETDRPTAILRDASTGQVRAILRNPPNGQIRGNLRDLAGPDGAQAVAFGAEQGLETFFSRGIPDAAAWRR